jgi:hypothetical protein
VLPDKELAKPNTVNMDKKPFGYKAIQHITPIILSCLICYMVYAKLPYWGWVLGAVVLIIITIQDK